jgi:hypothetical protein
MPRYPEGFGAAEFDGLKVLVTQLGAHGAFSANELSPEHRIA